MEGKVICKGCGKEFEQRSGVGRPKTYCSEQCRISLKNRRFLENQVKKRGMSYYAWRRLNGWRRLNNYPVPKEKKREYNRKFKDNQFKKLGMSYWAWRWRNDPAYKEKKLEYSHKYNRLLTERRRDRKKEEK